MNTAKTTMGTNQAVERWLDEGGKDLSRSAGAESDDVASLRERLTEIDESITGWVKEHPIAATATALSVGYVVGRILGRR